MEAVTSDSKNPIHCMRWKEFHERIKNLITHIKSRHDIKPIPLTVYGVPRGGTFVAMALDSYDGFEIVNTIDAADLVVDDIIDSGETLKRYSLKYPNKPLFALIDKKRIVTHADLGWICFPWEQGEVEGSAGPIDAVVRMLQFIGEDVTRDGLLDTPKRVVKALAEMTSGYREDSKEILSKQFDIDHDEMIVLSGIRFTSLCEHHMLPFSGFATVGYIPKERIVGISKLARLVECFARRLQVQERMTNQIAEAVQEELDPLGVGVVIKARHECMGCRGVTKPEAKMITSRMTGLLMDHNRARSEFMSFVE